MATFSRFRALQPLPGVILAAAAAVTGYILRYGFVEPDRLGAACERGNPWWCMPRRLFIMVTEWNGLGWISVAVAATAVVLLARGRNPLPAAMLALGFGGTGMILYNATFSTVAVVAALLVLAHRPSEPT